MPDSVEIHGDQKNTWVSGFSGLWVVALTAVILVGIVGVIIAVGNIGSDAAEPLIAVSPPVVITEEVPRPAATSQSEVFKGKTEDIEERALPLGDTKNKVREQITVTTSGDQMVEFARAVEEEDVSIYAIKLRNLDLDVTAKVEILPVLNLDYVDVPPPPRSEFIQALLITVDGVGNEDDQAAELSFTLS